MEKINIAWAWWWTWGHVFPIKSLIQYLHNSGKFKAKVNNMVWFWKKWSLEEENYQQLKKYINNLYFCSILSWKRRREKSFSAICKNLWDLVLFSCGIVQSLFALKKYRIDVVFCKWGYVALPVVFAAKFLWKKIIVHESDVHPGLVNRIWSKYAKKTFTGFDNVIKGSETVGQILSDDLLPESSKKESKQTEVLVMWGSQWSKNLYEALAETLKNKELENMHFDIVLWKLNKETWKLFEGYKNVTCHDFLSQKEMWEYYLNSDIAITRAGTTSLAEQQLFDLKLIMIPIPWTHDQKDNAKWYVKNHEWILVDQDDPEFINKLQDTLLSLKSYKKSLSTKDRKKEISIAKEKILDAILYH